MTAETPRPWVERPRESSSSIWLRRALSVPSYLAIAVACFVGAPLWLFERWAELDAWVASHAVGDRSAASVVSA